MSDQVIGRPDVRSMALAEPIVHVGYRWIIGLTLASLGTRTSRRSTRSSRLGW